MRTSEKIDEIATSLFALRKELKQPTADQVADAGSYSYPYLSLPVLLEFIDGKIMSLSLSYAQEITRGDDGANITTRIMHSSGQWIELGPLFLPVKGNAQAWGSAISYGRRYAIAAAFGISARGEDDDAASATVEPRSTVTGSSEATGMAGADGSGAPASDPTSGAGVSDEDRGEGSTTQTSALLITPEQIDVLKQAAGGVQKARAASKESYGKDWRELTADEGLELIQRLQQINQAAGAVG